MTSLRHDASRPPLGKILAYHAPKNLQNSDIGAPSAVEPRRILAARAVDRNFHEPVATSNRIECKLGADSLARVEAAIQRHEVGAIALHAARYVVRPEAHPDIEGP